MLSTDVRARILAEHEELRRRLSRLERLARELLGGRGTEGPLREDGRRLYEMLCAHLDFEDAHLAPALRRAAEGGRQRCDRLARDHREQRELLRYVLERLVDASRPPVVLARDLLALAELLRSDMADEERWALREHVHDPEEESSRLTRRVPGGGGRLGC